MKRSVLFACVTVVMFWSLGTVVGARVGILVETTPHSLSTPYPGAGNYYRNDTIGVNVSLEEAGCGSNPIEFAALSASVNSQTTFYQEWNFPPGSYVYAEDGQSTQTGNQIIYTGSMYASVVSRDCAFANGLKNKVMNLVQ